MLGVVRLGILILGKERASTAICVLTKLSIAKCLGS